MNYKYLTLMSSLFLLLGAPLRAGRLEIVHEFERSGSNHVGALWEGADGEFFGVSGDGGGSYQGAAFRVTASGAFTILHHFTGTEQPADARAPSGGLVRGADGNFYGLSSGGGPGRQGTVFRMTPVGEVTLLHSFSGLDGFLPIGTPALDADGSIFGVTRGGGANNSGVAFRVSPAGEFAVFAAFGGTHGRSPIGGIVRAGDGSFYGVTEFGPEGDANGAGTLFRLTPSGALTTVKVFRNGEPANASSPQTAPLMGADGNLYGVTLFGGAAGTGTLYRYTMSGGFSLVHSFSFAAGISQPQLLVAARDGSLYGIGTGPTFFRATTAGVITPLHTFGTGEGVPQGLVEGRDGNFYCALFTGGFDGYPAFVRLSPQGVRTELRDLADEGLQPVALIRASDGNFYGATHGGGLRGLGTAFRVAPDGMHTLLHEFDGTDGQQPTALVEGRDGHLYGATGGDGGQFGIGGGVVFRLSEDGVFQKLHAFTAGIGAWEPFSLIHAADGNLYGLTTYGPGGYGALFRLGLDQQYTQLHSFASEPLIGVPYGELAEVGGQLFGIARSGQQRIIYRVAADGSVAPAASTEGFSGAGLVADADGSLLGTLETSLFRFTPPASITTEFSFGGPFGNPESLPIRGAGGLLYGVTNLSFANKGPQVYRISATGAYEAIYTFPGGISFSPIGPLVPGPDEWLYGIMQSGGAGGGGFIYRVEPVPNRAPVAQGDTFAPPATRLDVLANDSDPDGDFIFVQGYTQPAHGSLSRNEDGTFAYTPGPDFTETDSFSYTIVDPSGATGSATVTVSSLGDPDFEADGFVRVRGSADVEGALEMHFTAAGWFTGSLRLRGEHFGFRGRTGQSLTILRKGRSPLTLTFTALENGLAVAITDGTTEWEAIARRTSWVFGQRAPQAGRYTALIASQLAGDPAAVPPGSGFARIYVSARGYATIVGKLADGTPFSSGAVLDAKGALALSVTSRLSPHPQMHGTITFATVPGVSDCAGTLTWQRPANTRARQYAAGFQTLARFTGARYAPPIPGARVLDLGAAGRATVEFSQGDLPAAVRGAATISPDHTAIVEAPLRELRLDASTGIFSGRFIDVISNRERPFFAAILQKQNRGAGFFIGVTSGGAVALTPAP